MTITSIARSLRPEVHRALRVSETQRAFHDRVLDGVRKFLEDHAVTGKTGARDFYEFEAELHARLMEAEREIVGKVMAVRDRETIGSRDRSEVRGPGARRLSLDFAPPSTAALPLSANLRAFVLSSLSPYVEYGSLRGCGRAWVFTRDPRPRSEAGARSRLSWWRVVFAALVLVLAADSVARAQAAPDPDEFGDDVPRLESRTVDPEMSERARRMEEERLIEEDRVLSLQLLESSGGSLEMLAFREELRELDRRLRGRTRPASNLGAGLALIIPGGLGVVGGIVTLIAGALVEAGRAAGCATGAFFDGLMMRSPSACPPSGAGDLFMGGAVAIGLGVTTALAGLAVALSRGPDHAAFRRRDQLRRQLRLWVAPVADADGAALVLTVTL